MQRMLRKIWKTGYVTEQAPPADNDHIEILGDRLNERLRKSLNGSLAVRMVDAGSCNGCELEVNATNNPYYDLERFGVHFVASPRHADLLLVTGPVTRNMETALKMTYEATPAPKLVIALGDCATCGGEFGQSYASIGAVENVIPVDIRVHGCPPPPARIIAAMLRIIGQ